MLKLSFLRFFSIFLMNHSGLSIVISKILKKIEEIKKNTIRILQKKNYFLGSHRIHFVDYEFKLIYFKKKELNFF